MARFINRTIEEYIDELNTSYFMHGDSPKPRILLDDIERHIYTRLGVNHADEVIYMRSDY